LPVPAHTYVLKSSHAFNVRDARGAISTTERAQAFAKIRRLARDVSKLWVERREELGFPLLDAPAPKPVGEAVTPPTAGAGPSPAPGCAGPQRGGGGGHAPDRRRWPEPRFCGQARRVRRRGAAELRS